MGGAARQAPRYLSTAVFSALSDWLVFLLLGLFGAPPVGAQAVSRVVGGVVSFGLNKLWTYDAAGTRRGTTEAVRFLQLYALSYALSLGLLFLLVDVMGAPAGASKLAADGACFLFNFAAMRSWVFAEASGGGAREAGGARAEVREQVGQDVA